MSESMRMTELTEAPVEDGRGRPWGQEGHPHTLRSEEDGQDQDQDPHPEGQGQDWARRKIQDLRRGPGLDPR